MKSPGEERRADAARELRRAGRLFEADGEHGQATACLYLAREVEAEDRELQDAVLAKLPERDETRVRPEDVARLSGVKEELIFKVLEALRKRSLASAGGGWWRKR